MPFDEEYDRYKALLDDLVGKMQNVMESGVIPPKIKGQKCSGCSIKDLCMPKTKKYSIKQTGRYGIFLRGQPADLADFQICGDGVHTGK
jgi:hypothetical protein